MKIEFKKSKYPVIKICVVVLILYFILYFTLINPSILRTKVSFNVEFNKKTDEVVFVCLKDFCKSLDDNSIVGNKTGLANIKSAQFDYWEKNTSKINSSKIYFAIPNNIKNPQNIIKNVDLYVDNSSNHIEFSEINKFENKIMPIFLEKTGEQKDYRVFVFDNINSYLENKKEDVFVDFILNDYKNYKGYKFVVYSIKKDKPLELKDVELEWKYLEQKLFEIEKQLSKTVVYFDSDAVELDIAAIKNAKMKIYNTNSNRIAKLIFN